MTMDSTGASPHLEATSLGQEQAVRRICARVAAPAAGVDVQVASLPLGGVQVWLDAPRQRWHVHHRMARELRLAGWHTETGPDRLLLLGWSAVFLGHRARMLGAALSGRLAHFDRTAFMAVMLATRLRHQGCPPGYLAAVVEARCRDELRWPERLSDLRGLERRSSLEPLRLRLAQVAGLEAKVARRCGEHLALAGKVARMVAGGAPQYLLDAPARDLWTDGLGDVSMPAGRRRAHPASGTARDVSGRGAGLTERLVCISVPNVDVGGTDDVSAVITP
ncbi:hypothetical protein SAMN05421874_11228 [Nonomuraea maritima]|uniref:Uncharacterized protein n=1 Tax=Nonomuraea maritima TaxID=683260 RepID=A0A1G9FBL7_9ACTN|nr:hypothetical protein [Nonomuraea maritima]SDK85751.1 hypothetical protein SAMN05421874_11228 [Nonomuraea maritima]